MSNRLIQAAALVLTAVGIVCAFLLSPTINQQRVDRQLTYDLEVGSNANPAYMLGSSLGSFRGVLINFLWQRSEALKQEEKFFESNNLAEYITTLQPRFPDAWDIQAWNMAYNISVKTKTPEERWDWVNKGMTLLRDRGIPNNPNAVVLYRSIAWILGHKMTGQTDDMHYYYKARMAEEWQVVLGAPDPGWDWKPEFRNNRPLEEDFDELTHGEWLTTRQFAKIANMAKTYLEKDNRTEGDYRPSNYFTTLSPENLERFYNDHPGLEGVVKELEALKGPNGEDLELGLNAKTLRAFGTIQMYQDAGYNINSPTVFNRETLGIDAMALYLWINKKGQDPTLRLNLQPRVSAAEVQARFPDQQVIDFVSLLNMMRALTLVDKYHMDPAFMLKTMEDFGPIDWRHPAAHALYWSALGTLRAEEWTQNKERIDFINANRNIIHNLQHLAHQGKINFRPKVAGMGEFGEETINHTPDIRMIPAYNTAWQAVMDKIEAGEFGEQKKTQTYENGHENFLHSAVYLYYYNGQEARAYDYFQRAKQLYENNPQSPSANDGHYELSVPDFARVRLDDDLGFQNTELILYRIRMAWQQGLAQRSQNVMRRMLGAAKATYDEFLEPRQNTRKFDEDVQARQGLPPFEVMVRDTFLEIMISPAYSLPQKAQIWELARPLLISVSEERALVHESYGLMMPALQRRAEVEGLGIDIATYFPQPAGYDEWYRENINPDQPPSLPGLPE